MIRIPKLDKQSWKMIPIWCLSIFVIGMVLGMLALVANLIAEDLNSVINPCLNRGIYNVSNKTCDCSLSFGLFGGDFCEQHQCKNNGILIKNHNHWVLH